MLKFVVPAAVVPKLIAASLCRQPRAAVGVNVDDPPHYQAPSRALWRAQLQSHDTIRVRMRACARGGCAAGWGRARRARFYHINLTLNVHALQLPAIVLVEPAAGREGGGA